MRGIRESQVSTWLRAASSVAVILMPILLKIPTTGADSRTHVMSNDDNPPAAVCGSAAFGLDVGPALGGSSVTGFPGVHPSEKYCALTVDAHVRSASATDANFMVGRGREEDAVSCVFCVS